MFTKESYRAIDKCIANHPVNIIISREGAGKSFYARHCVQTLRNVVFLCSTNKQAEEQANNFINAGFATQLVKSKSCKLKEFGIDVTVVNNEYGFGVGEIDIDATLTKYPTSTHEQIREVIKSTVGDSFDLTGKHQVICATFWQKNQIADFESDDWVVMFDDPNAKDLQNILKLNSNVDINGINPEFQPRRETVIEGFAPIVYIKRPKRLDLTYGIKIPIVLTSTEVLISRMAVENLGAELLDFREYQENNNIHLIGSPLVRKDRDYMVSILAQHIGIELIGDGIPGSNNKHISTKGSNSLMDVPLLIEVSYPHPLAIIELMLEFPNQSQTELRLLYMVDQLHQAIGRNQGHRYKGQPCYVLIDVQWALRASELLQYKHKFYSSTDDIFAYLNELYFTEKRKDRVLQEIQRFTKYPMQLINVKSSNGKFIVTQLIQQMNMSCNDLAIIMNQLKANFSGEQIDQLCSHITNLMNEGQIITN